jgi:hypothetical protein
MAAQPTLFNNKAFVCSLALINLSSLAASSIASYFPLVPVEVAVPPSSWLRCPCDPLVSIERRGEVGFKVLRIDPISSSSASRLVRRSRRVTNLARELLDVVVVMPMCWKRIGCKIHQLFPAVEKG